MVVGRLHDNRQAWPATSKASRQPRAGDGRSWPTTAGRRLGNGRCHPGYRVLVCFHWFDLYKRAYFGTF